MAAGASIRRGRELSGLGCPDCGGSCLGDASIASLCDASNPSSPLNSSDPTVVTKALNDCGILGIQVTIAGPGAPTAGSNGSGGSNSQSGAGPLPLAPGGISFSPGTPGTTSGFGLGLVNLPSVPESAFSWWQWLLLFGLLGIAVYAGVKIIGKEL